MATSSLPRTSGIYKITCTANGRFYIGSSNDCKHRWMYHRRDLRAGKHHSVHLQRAYNKYGEKFFQFEVIEYVMPWSLLEREQYWLDKLKPEFNGCRLADRPTFAGKKHTPETRAKISIAQIGHTLSPESRAKISAARKGTKRDPLVTEKIASQLRGRKLKPEHVAKVVAANRGRKHSLETRRKNGEAHSKNYIVVSPDGTQFTVRNLKQFCRENNLCYTSLARVASGTSQHYKGWKCKHG